MRPLSHSSISLYLECPLKYKYRYIDGLKEKPRSYFSFGSSMHQTLEYFFGSKFSIAPSIDEVIDYYEKNWINEGYKSPGEEESYRKEGRRILTEFYNKHTNPYKRPLSVEHSILFEVDGVKVKAVIDRIDKIDDKSVEIIDYKTTKSPYNLSELKEEPQLTMYQLAVEQEMGLRVERLTYYHLLSLTPFTIPRHSDENAAALKSRIVDVARKIENREFPYQENRHCPCDFGHLCPLFMHKYRREEVKPGAVVEDIVKIVDEYGQLKDDGKEREAKLAALQDQIKEYLNKQKIERVFGDKYEVTRSKGSSERLDAKKAKQLLEEKGLLDGMIYTVESETIRYKTRRDSELA